MSTQFTFECVLYTLSSIIFFHFYSWCKGKSSQEKQRNRAKKDRIRFKYVIGSLETGNSVYRFKRKKNNESHWKAIAQIGGSGAFQLQFTWLWFNIYNST